jgi:hypothetical protein
MLKIILLASVLAFSQLPDIKKMKKSYDEWGEDYVGNDGDW